MEASLTRNTRNPLRFGSVHSPKLRIVSQKLRAESRLDEPIQSNRRTKPLDTRLPFVFLHKMVTLVGQPTKKRRFLHGVLRFSEYLSGRWVFRAGRVRIDPAVGLSYNQGQADYPLVAPAKSLCVTV